MRSFNLTFLLLFFLISFSTFSQTIFYTYNDLLLEEIESYQNWKPLEKPIYNGFENGIYWFKISLPKSSEKRVIAIPESHITIAHLFKESTKIDKYSNKTRYVRFHIPPSTEKQIYYLKVNCLLEGRIPISIKTINKYYDDEQKEFWIIGLYQGIVLCIILINLFSYVNIKDKMYLHYIFMVIGMSFNAFFKDGVFALLLGHDFSTGRLELIINSIVVVSSIFFTNSYLQLENYPSTKKYKNIGISFVIIALVINIIYQFTGSFTLFTISSIILVIPLDVFWLISIVLWKKSNYAKFFAIAYGLPLLLAHDYYIIPYFGIHGLDLSVNFYKLGSIFEMMVFTFAIMYQTKQLKEENRSMRKKINEYIQLLKAQVKEDDIEKDLALNYNFTAKEIEIFKALSLKKTNRQIAEEQFISENTVKFHIKNIFTKLEVKSRNEARKKYVLS